MADHMARFPKRPISTETRGKEYLWTTHPKLRESPSLNGHRFLSTILALWPVRSIQSDRVVSTCKVADSYNDSTRDEKQHTLCVKSFISSGLGRYSKLPINKGVLPRHVPIIIPDFAQSFVPQDSQQLSEHFSRLELNKGHLDAFIPRPVVPHANLRHRAEPNQSMVDAEGRKVFEPGAKMNSSQVSLSASESGVDHANGASPSLQSPSGPTGGIVSPISQSGSGGANLSGLVCNVHKTTGQEPHALVGATTTILGDKLYVFGGRIHSRSRPQLTSDLYELDLVRRHWTRIDTIGEIPPPRYFHSVCALGDTKLVCYGGMSPANHLKPQVQSQQQRPAADAQPEVVVMSDIHIYDVLTRRWHLVAVTGAGSDTPQGRYAHCAAILPSSAVFTSPSAPHSAIHHNKSPDSHSGTLGVQLDGAGGAEMIVVGGQDSANNYIEQISVFNLRSLKWTSITAYDRKCGAYKSMVAPLIGLNARNLGRGLPLNDPSETQTGTSMLIYSNYNFLDVKLELQVRLPDGTIIERQMAQGESPPGLRFPNGGITSSHFVVSGTYLTSSKHEYALWALDLRTLTWHRIDTAGSVFSTGSWNRGVLWNRRNQFVILGHRKRNLVDDYNHRRINFGHVCMVELEAFGLYDNPRTVAPTSSYISRSSPAIPMSLQSSLASNNAGGRQLSNIAEQLGQTALAIAELSDMELIAMGGERVPCNSQILSKRWGPFFNQLLQEACIAADNRTISDATTLRANMHSQASRASTVTITPSVTNGIPAGGAQVYEAGRSMSQSTTRTLLDVPNGSLVPASSRPRALYLPHTISTLRILLHYLYTSSLPPLSSPLCTPHTLCSLLQMARPYQIDGLLEATVERLHEVLEGRNAAAVFNAAAMAAGGGRATGLASGGTLAELERRESQPAANVENDHLTTGMSHLSISNGRRERGHQKSNSTDSTTSTASMSQTDTESSTQDSEAMSRDRGLGAQAWSGEMSSVIGLQKRGLRGLMEGRRLRERATTTAADS